MTNVRIQVDSIALGEVSVTVEDSFVIRGDDDHARYTIEQLLEDAVAKIRRAYGITEENQ